MPEKKWVFDTVTLSNFLLSNSTPLLAKRYRGRAVITSQVLDEILGGIREKRIIKQIKNLLKANIFAVVSLTEQELKDYQSLLGHLGRGEASCIVYAKRRRAIVVSNDRAARAQCLLMKVRFTGTIGILAEAVRRRQIKLEEADAVLARMIEFGFYSPVRSISDIINE